jgi:hypothetical protein
MKRERSLISSSENVDEPDLAVMDIATLLVGVPHEASFGCAATHVMTSSKLNVQ